MNSIDHRPSFFPRNPRNQKTKNQTKSEGISSDLSLKELQIEKRNTPEKAAALSQKTSLDAKVSIPEGIRDFSRIKKAAISAEEPDNSEKIARLKKQIQEGTYEIDYDALANKILESEF